MNRVRCKLGEILTLTRGASLKGEYFTNESDYLRLTLANFCESGGFKEFKNTEDKYYKGNFDKKYLMKKGDLITPLTEQTYGLLGSVAFIPESDKYIQSQDIGLLTVNDKKIDKIYAYYLFLTSSVRKQISAGSQQTKIRHTSADKVHDVIVEIPMDVGDQKKIGSFLKTIDDKIALNNKINKELESMMKTIYDYWFLQYEFPNEEGKPYKSSGGKMVWNDELKQEIPEGWEVQNIVENRLSKVIKAGINLFEGSKRYLATADIDGVTINYNSSEITYEKRETRANMQPIANSIWFAKMKNSKKLVSFRDNKFLMDNYILSTGMFGLVTDENAYEYIYNFIKDDRFEYLKDTLAHGNTQESVNNQDLLSIPFLIPRNNVLNDFHLTTKSIKKQLEIKDIENIELSNLRDWLLPMLMNGQVVIS